MWLSQQSGKCDFSGAPDIAIHCASHNADTIRTAQPQRASGRSWMHHGPWIINNAFPSIDCIMTCSYITVCFYLHEEYVWRTESHGLASFSIQLIRWIWFGATTAIVAGQAMYFCQTLPEKGSTLFKQLCVVRSIQSSKPSFPHSGWKMSNISGTFMKQRNKSIP